VDLAQHRIVHRDISMGNILLAREVENTTFFDGASRKESDESGLLVIFRQRTIIPAGNFHGVLHDFDMAGRLYHPQDTSSYGWRAVMKQPQPSQADPGRAFRVVCHLSCARQAVVKD
jgi:hypothetical protein